nr:glutamate receptor AMPA [Hymenolepis microstoma]
MEGQMRTRGSTKIEKEKSPETKFKKGKYVMAKWKNNVDYLAQVLDYRKNLEGDLMFHIVFIWDNIAEWHSASNLKLATDEQVREILEEIKQIKSASKDSQKKFSVELQSAADEDDMIYDPNHTQFQEACRKRRERQRRSLSSDLDSAQSEAHAQKSPIQSDSPASKSKQTPIRKPISIVNKPLVTPTANKKPITSAKPVVATPNAKAPPQSFQCQYCPRTLRKQDLLESHIYHYHSDKIKSGPQHAEVPPSTQKRRKQETEPTSESLLISEGNLKECFMYCKNCKTSGSVIEPEANIIQCRVCLVWSHRKCSECFNEPSWICTFCRREPSASSLTDWGNDPENFRASGPTRSEDIDLDEISKEIDALLQWLKKLRLLVNSGRHIVLRIKRQNAASGSNTAGNAQLSQNRSVDSELSIDLLCSGSHTEEQFGTLDSPDISRLLANIPTNLPDLTITDDLLNVVQPSSSQSQHGVSSSNAASNVSSAFDTPTKNLINSIFQSMTIVEAGNSTSPTAGSTGTVITTPTATAIEADLQKAVPMDTLIPMTCSNNISPYLTTPVKTTSRRATNSSDAAGDIEAAASLIGFPETSTSGSIAVRNAPLAPSSQDLELLNQEVLIPLEQMIGLIEGRLEFLEGKIEEALGADEDDADSGSGSQESMLPSPPHGRATYPPTKFVSARRRPPNGHPCSLLRQLMDTSFLWASCSSWMSEATVSHEQTFEEDATENVNCSSQTDAPIEVTMNSSEIEVPEIPGDSEYSRPPRKRRKRKRKRFTSDSLEVTEEGDNTTSEIGLVQCGFHSAFHGVVYDVEGNPKEITFREDKTNQVNRKRQKRLGTCTFKISTEMEPKTAIAIPAKQGRNSTTSTTSNRRKPKVKNLEVRIHKYENTYDNVVKYWYSTLDWIDKAAMELQQTEENEEYYEDSQVEEGEYGYNASEFDAQQVVEQPVNENLDEANRKTEDFKQTNEETKLESLTEVKNNIQGNINVMSVEGRSSGDSQQMDTQKGEANVNTSPEKKVNEGNKITD